MKNDKKWLIKGLIYAGIFTSISVLVPWWYDEEISVLKVLFYLVFWLIMQVSFSYVTKSNQNKK